MKKNLAFVFTLVFLLSCKKSEFEYSCSPVINKFVVENLKELSEITIKELASYDFHLQRAIFNSWDYQKKRNAWIEKLNYVLVSLPLTEKEKAHVQALIATITEDYFLRENIEKNPEIRTRFAVEWINYSTREFGWSEQFIAFMVYRLYTDQAQLYSELSILISNRTTNKTDSEGDCECNVSVDFCGLSLCESGGCTISTGCGWLWSMPCDGKCY